MPVLVLQGGDDPLVNPGDAPFFFDLIRSEIKTLKEYPGLYHELHNEPEKDQVLADITAWIEERLASFSRELPLE